MEKRPKVPMRIPVATDGSVLAMNAEIFAADLAVRLSEGGECRIAVATVAAVTKVDVAERSQLFVIDEVEWAENTAQEGADRVRGLLGDSKVPVEARLVEAESPAKGIIEEAHATGECSLIIMGNRGRGGFSGLLLGSVSHQVLEGAHCPVLIVRE